MSGSGVYYSQSQIATMQSAVGQARQALNAGNYAGVTSALDSYYSVQVYQPGTQTVMRGYAELALQMVNDTGNGVVANQEVANAVGATDYTPKFQANLAFQLANQDLLDIQGTAFQVPTLAQVATDHAQVFGNLQIPITAWGGTLYAETSLQDPTYVQNYSLDLTPGSKDCNAILAG